ncbi:MAG: hypothetical protein ABEK01_03265 [Candidatus Nanohaloarchaea archaeon]
MGSVSLPESISLSEGDSGTQSSAIGRNLSVTAALTASGIAGRVALQHIPSVETVLPVAVAVGFYHDWRHGAASGVSGYYVTNFLVWGGQGPWTLFQMVGAGMAGASGGLFSKLSRNGRSLAAALATGTVLFELSVNLGSVIYVPMAASIGLAYFAAAIPYGLIHLTSSIGIGLTIHGFNRQIRQLYRQD